MNNRLRIQLLRRIKSLRPACRPLSTIPADNFQSIRYFKEDRVAHIELNRPDRLNAIDEYMPFEIQKAVQRANIDDDIHVILLYGAGEAFCAGYDLKAYGEEQENKINQKMPWDPALDFQ